MSQENNFGVGLGAETRDRQNRQSRCTRSRCVVHREIARDDALRVRTRGHRPRKLRTLHRQWTNLFALWSPRASVVRAMDRSGLLSPSDHIPSTNYLTRAKHLSCVSRVIQPRFTKRNGPRRIAAPFLLLEIAALA